MRRKDTRKGRRAFLLGAPALLGGALAWLRRSAAPRRTEVSPRAAARRLDPAPFTVKRREPPKDGRG